MEEINISGEMAYTRGRLLVTLMPHSGGDTQVIKRRFLEIWRQENERWLVVRTMDNTE